MKGYRTIALNVVGLLAAFATMAGFEVSPTAQAEIVAGVLAVGNIVMRFFTDTTVGKSN